ncbi:hypothetical protein H6P81_016085 [Aristolochia fimbriata]|uniref:Uncharacterized protein n=1 Tax=Aristolochia fimbriata TaxID=158543 RepID=A0AAV7E9E3_ARIFI|nr:hypothetical protein H6P81_016085 [Aristolochia fimbriata]
MIVERRHFSPFKLLSLSLTKKKMSSMSLPIDDKDLDDAELWAVIDSAAATHSSSKSRKILAIKQNNVQTFLPSCKVSPQPLKLAGNPPNRRSFDEESRDSVDGEVFQEPWVHQRPQKIGRFSDDENRILVFQRSPMTPPSSYASPDFGNVSVQEIRPAVHSPGMQPHCLSGRFPTVSLFKEYQNAAMSILEKGDYTMISGSPYIKKSGWRKISFFFNLSYEIKDKSIEFDENRNVQRAEFLVRAYMQGGRFSDGWGSCERREKRFSRPNHDIPSTAETRAKNKACQDLLGIGQYQAGSSKRT